MHEGPEEPSRALLHTAGIWTYDLHEEIYVFDSGFWMKDHNLWLEVQKADWEDVILKDDFKKNLMKDVFGFFDSEELYKKLSIPWKVRLMVTMWIKPMLIIASVVLSCMARQVCILMSLCLPSLLTGDRQRQDHQYEGYHERR